MSWMETYSGKLVFVSDFRPNMVEEVDIAHALAHQCRYAGHCSSYYSVAEHCCHVSDWVLLQSGSYCLAQSALLHDAAEAYLIDVPRPVKAQLSEYKRLEKEIMSVIVNTFDIRHPSVDIIRQADERILIDEKKALFPRSQHKWGPELDGLKPLGVTIEGWDPTRAKEQFLRRLFCITGES